MKKFLDSKAIELVACILMLGAMAVTVWVKPCSFGGFALGFLVAFTMTKIMARIGYKDSKTKKSKKQ